MLKRLMPKTLFARALLIVVLPVILAQVLIAIVFYDRHLERTVMQLARSVAGDISYIAQALADTQIASDRTRIIQRANTTMQIRFVYHVGQTVSPGVRPQGSSPVEELLFVTLDQELTTGYRILPRPERKQYEITIPIGNNALIAVVPRNRVTAGTAHILVLWVIGISAFILSIALLFLRNQIRPIRRLAEASDRFGKGQDVSNFRPQGAAEVRQAGNAFLRMQERIARQVRQRTEMLAGVSHDLRTPLTRMKLSLTMMPQGDDVTAMQEDIDEMHQMIDGYLAFARGAQGEAVTEIDVGQLLQEIIARDEQINLTLDGDMVIPCRPQTLKRSISNIIENAKRFGTNVAVSAVRVSDGLDIHIDDDGPGIPDDKLQDVFRPFTRLEASRNQNTGGVGLGLAIARDGMRSHGGDVTLSTSPLGGLRANIRIPI